LQAEERIKMPNRRYVEKGVVFTPQALSAMGQALQATTETLGIGSDELRRQAVAKFLIRLAREDGSLDATTLRDKAVVALGGVAYRDMAAGAGRDDKALNHRNCPC
jgi:hypothetical protein